MIGLQYRILDNEEYMYLNHLVNALKVFKIRVTTIRFCTRFCTTKPLPAGKHELTSKGSSLDITTTATTTFVSDVTYHLTVQ